MILQSLFFGQIYVCFCPLLSVSKFFFYIYSVHISPFFCLFLVHLCALVLAHKGWLHVCQYFLSFFSYNIYSFDFCRQLLSICVLCFSLFLSIYVPLFRRQKFCVLKQISYSKKFHYHIVFCMFHFVSAVCFSSSVSIHFWPYQFFIYLFLGNLPALIIALCDCFICTKNKCF